MYKTITLIMFLIALNLTAIASPISQVEENRAILDLTEKYSKTLKTFHRGTPLLVGIEDHLESIKHHEIPTLIIPNIPSEHKVDISKYPSTKYHYEIYYKHKLVGYILSTDRKTELVYDEYPDIEYMSSGNYLFFNNLGDLLAKQSWNHYYMDYHQGHP